MSGTLTWIQLSQGQIYIQGYWNGELRTILHSIIRIIGTARSLTHRNLLSFSTRVEDQSEKRFQGLDTHKEIVRDRMSLNLIYLLS